MCKITAFILGVLLFFDFFGSYSLRAGFAKIAGLEMLEVVRLNPQYDEVGELLTYDTELRWNGHRYAHVVSSPEVFTGVVDDDKRVGHLWGLTPCPGSDQVFTVVGFRPEEWLFWLVATPMGFYILYKEKKVTEIPEALRDLC
jgi:hypothetical protein